MGSKQRVTYQFLPQSWSVWRSYLKLIVQVLRMKRDAIIFKGSYLGKIWRVNAVIDHLRSRKLCRYFIILNSTHSTYKGRSSRERFVGSALHLWVTHRWINKFVTAPSLSFRKRYTALASGGQTFIWESPITAPSKNQKHHSRWKTGGCCKGFELPQLVFVRQWSLADLTVPSLYIRATEHWAYYRL